MEPRVQARSRLASRNYMSSYARRCASKRCLLQTEERYVDWIKRFILFDSTSHPLAADTGAPTGTRKNFLSAIQNKTTW